MKVGALLTLSFARKLVKHHGSAIGNGVRHMTAGAHDDTFSERRP